LQVRNQVTAAVFTVTFENSESLTWRDAFFTGVTRSAGPFKGNHVFIVIPKSLMRSRVNLTVPMGVLDTVTQCDCLWLKFKRIQRKVIKCFTYRVSEDWTERI
jgi:hypothetical protein